MHSISSRKSTARHEQYRGAFCARTFNNVAVFVRHAFVVCLIFIDVLALRRLIVQPRTELAVIPAA